VPGPGSDGRGTRLEGFRELFTVLNTANLVDYENKIVDEDFGQPGAAKRLGISSGLA
jgi:hypothetical protein